MVRKFSKTLIVCFVFAGALNRTPALANLISSTPDANAIVTQGAEVGPQIDLQFSEKVEINRSRFVVVGPKGRHLTTTIGQDVNDKSLVFISIWNEIFPGKYTVDWQTASPERRGIGSHGSFTFTVKYAKAADKPQ